MREYDLPEQPDDQFEDEIDSFSLKERRRKFREPRRPQDKKGTRAQRSRSSQQPTEELFPPGNTLANRRLEQPERPASKQPKEDNYETLSADFPDLEKYIKSFDIEHETRLLLNRLKRFESDLKSQNFSLREREMLFISKVIVFERFSLFWLNQTRDGENDLYANSGASYHIFKGLQGEERFTPNATHIIFGENLPTIDEILQMRLSPLTTMESTRKDIEKMRNLTKRSQGRTVRLQKPVRLEEDGAPMEIAHFSDQMKISVVVPQNVHFEPEGGRISVINGPFPYDFIDRAGKIALDTARGFARTGTIRNQFPNR